MIPALLLLGLLSPFQKVYRTAVPEHKIFGQPLDPDNTCMAYVPYKPGQRVFIRYRGRTRAVKFRRLLVLPEPTAGRVIRSGWAQYYVLDSMCNLPDREIVVE